MTIEGIGELTVSTDTLHSFPRFRRACREQLGVEFARIRPADWYVRLEEALAVLRGEGEVQP